MNIKICKSCLTPNSRPRVVFDDEGFCNACLNSHRKKKIKWQDRKDQFDQLIVNLKNYKEKNNTNYHCIVPWSGGKDSTSIALKLKFEFGLEPLLVTFSPLVQNDVGSYNRKALIDKGFDSIFFAPNGKISSLLARRFFIERGNPKVAWDAGINSLPVKIAKKYKIPYIFYAEHGESEYGGLVLNEKSQMLRDKEEVLEHQIGDYPENWVSEEISENDIQAYVYDEDTDFEINAYYFSYFFKWDMYENYQYVKKVLPEFKTVDRSEGTFTNFDSLDDKIDSLYYYMQYIKFGFGRCVRDASRLIQNGHITRDKGLKYVQKYDDEFPKKYLEENLKFLNITELDFEEIVNKHRNEEVWKSKNNYWKKSFDIV
jgi:N-acetyl sugar amidotransferase